MLWLGKCQRTGITEGIEEFWLTSWSEAFPCSYTSGGDYCRADNDRDRSPNHLYNYVTDLDLVLLAGINLGSQINSTMLHKHVDGCKIMCQDLSAFTKFTNCLRSSALFDDCDLLPLLVSY